MSNGTNGNGSDAGNIDLMGWDTVFALRLEALNASIKAQKTTPPNYDGTDPQTQANVTGTWDDWSVLGGEGNGIIMSCPIKTGTLSGGGLAPATLDGGNVEVMITLVSQKSDSQLNDPTAKEGTGQTHHFKANQTTDEFQRPRVQSVTAPGLAGIDIYAAEAAFTAYFENNLAAFDAVFAAIRLEEEAIEAGKQWLKPVASLYAMASVPDDQSQTSFALLSLTSQPTGPLPQQNFDIRMFDVFKDTTTPTNSVFAISAPLSMQYLVLQAAKSCVMGATDDDFHIVNDGITVANKNTLNWGNFQLTKDDPTSIVVPVIQPGDFQLTLDGMNFHLSISQASFTTPDGTADVKLTADQYFNVEAAKLSDGNYYLVPSAGLGTNSIRADVTPNKGFEIAMIIESITVGVVFGFMGAGLGEALGGAATATTEGAEGVIEASSEGLDEEISNLSEEELSEAESSAESEAEGSIASGGSEDSTGNTGIFSNKYKVWGGVLGGMFGIPVGVLPQIMQLIWQDKITEGNVPTIDNFATNFSAAIQWPYVDSWQVTGGTFRAAFLLGGNAATSGTSE